MRKVFNAVNSLLALISVGGLSVVALGLVPWGIRAVALIYAVRSGICVSVVSAHAESTQVRGRGGGGVRRRRLVLSDSTHLSRDAHLSSSWSVFWDFYERTTNA